MPVLRHLKLGLLFGLLAPVAAVSSCTINEVNVSPDGGFPAIDGGGTPTPADAGDAGEPDAARTDGVIREVAFHQLTTAAEHAPWTVPAFSKNGKRVAFSTTDNTGPTAKNLIWVVDADGSNLKQVDSYTPLCYCSSSVAISDDGNTIASTENVQTRIVDVATGTLKNSVVFGGNETSAIALTGDGSHVFIQQRRDSNIVGSGTPVERGIYKLAATSGAAPTQFLSVANVAAVAGNPPAANVFPFSGCSGGLAVSSDGSKVVSSVEVSGAQMVVAGTGNNATVVIPPLSEGYKYVFSLGMTSDGSKVTYYVSANNSSGADVGVIGTDGSNRKKLFEASSGDACGTRLMVSDDGKNVALGKYGLVLPSDGTDPWYVLTATGSPTSGYGFVGEPDHTNSRDMSMSGDGKRFVYPSSEYGGARHIAIAELDASALGPVPTVTEPHVSVPSITRSTATVNGSRAYLTARAPVGVFVGGQIFLDGLVENGNGALGRVALLDDGKTDENFHDTAAGDGLYTSGSYVYAQIDAKPGKRVLRVKAETKDAASGKRSGHFVDFGPFAVE